MAEPSAAGRAMRRGAGAAVLLLCGALAAAGAEVGGGFFPAYGPGRIAVKRSGLAPVEFLANLRFDFDGAPADFSGTGRVLAYDDAGLDVIDEFPCTWTTKGGSAFRADLLGQELTDFLASLLGDAVGAPVALVLERADCRGVLRSGGEEVKAVIQVAGTASIDGGLARPFRARMRVK
jgi:hypothetical protein